MKYLMLLLISIGLGACASRPAKIPNDRMMLDLHTNMMRVIPEYCTENDGSTDIPEDCLDY